MWKVANIIRIVCALLIIICGFNFKQNGARTGCFQGFNSLSTTLSMPLWSAKW